MSCGRENVKDYSWYSKTEVFRHIGTLAPAAALLGAPQRSIQIQIRTFYYNFNYLWKKTV